MLAHGALVGQGERVGADFARLEQAHAVSSFHGAKDKIEVRGNVGAEKEGKVRPVVEVTADASDLTDADEAIKCILEVAGIAVSLEVAWRTYPSARRKGSDTVFYGCVDCVHG